MPICRGAIHCAQLWHVTKESGPCRGRLIAPTADLSASLGYSDVRIKCSTCIIPPAWRTSQRLQMFLGLHSASADQQERRDFAVAWHPFSLSGRWTWFYRAFKSKSSAAERIE